VPDLSDYQQGYLPKQLPTPAPFPGDLQTIQNGPNRQTLNAYTGMQVPQAGGQESVASMPAYGVQMMANGQEMMTPMGPGGAQLHTLAGGGASPVMAGGRPQGGAMGGFEEYLRKNASGQWTDDAGRARALQEFTALSGVQNQQDKTGLDRYLGEGNLGIAGRKMTLDEQLGTHTMSNAPTINKVVEAGIASNLPYGTIKSNVNNAQRLLPQFKTGQPPVQVGPPATGFAAGNPGAYNQGSQGAYQVAANGTMVPVPTAPAAAAAGKAAPTVQPGPGGIGPGGTKDAPVNPGDEQTPPEHDFTATLGHGAVDATKGMGKGKGSSLDQLFTTLHGQFAAGNQGNGDQHFANNIDEVVAYARSLGYGDKEINDWINTRGTGTATRFANIFVNPNDAEILASKMRNARGRPNPNAHLDARQEEFGGVMNRASNNMDGLLRYVGLRK
jgi:hypothetical protein